MLHNIRDIYIFLAYFKTINQKLDFSIWKFTFLGTVYEEVPSTDDVAESSNRYKQNKINLENSHVLKLWKQQFADALMVSYFTLNCLK